jgi:hypothetical protein
LVIDPDVEIDEYMFHIVIRIISVSFRM